MRSYVCVCGGGGVYVYSVCVRMYVRPRVCSVWSREPVSMSTKVLKAIGSDSGVIT